MNWKFSCQSRTRLGTIISPAMKFLIIWRNLDRVWWWHAGETGYHPILKVSICIKKTDSPQKSKVARFFEPFIAVKQVAPGEGEDWEEFERVHVSFQSTSSCNFSSVNSLNHCELTREQRERGRGKSKRNGLWSPLLSFHLEGYYPLVLSLSRCILSLPLFGLTRFIMSMDSCFSSSLS